MLQIISKKFFKSDNPDTYHSTEEKVLIYSNADTLEKIITTPLAKLEKISFSNEITTYLLRYNNCLEKQSTIGFELVAVGQSEIINDLICCFTLGFGKIFTTDKNYLIKLLKKKQDDVADKEELPRRILPAYFEPKMIPSDSITNFNLFFNNLIGLKRAEYKIIIKSIRQFYDAILLLNSNPNLSYSMFVAIIEALAQKFDNFQTKWEDCPDNIVSRLNILFNYLCTEISTAIKKVIIEEFHVKLKRRYVSYALNHISLEYFSYDAKDAENPVSKSILKKVIENSYDQRSKHLHSLAELPEIISIIGKSEIAGKNKDVQFTFSGITRFCRYIILEEIKCQDKVEKEVFNYFDDLPGRLFLPMAPQYWIHNPHYLTPQKIIKYFNAFISYFLDVRLGVQEKNVDLRNVCEKIEVIFATLNSENKRRLLIIYALYNTFIEDNYQVANYEAFFEGNIELIDSSTLENFIFGSLFLLTGRIKTEWTIEELESIYLKYDKERLWNDSVKLPKILETCLLLEIANLYLNVNKKNKYDEYIIMAIEENPGDVYLLEILNNIESDKRQIIDWNNKYLIKK